MKIGLIGMGVVGKALHNSLPKEHDVYIYDPYLLANKLAPIMDTEAVFVCVPTPTILGKQDDSILVRTIIDLKASHYSGMVIIKSTWLPSLAQEAVSKYKELDIMVSPEFLDQNKPYFEQDKHLLGVQDIYQKILYSEIFNNKIDIRTTNIKTALVAKYTHNCYGAIKVAFFNEIKDVCDDLDVDYREMMGAMLGMTDHISRNYTRMAVDGERGFGGACFPKDAVAFTSVNSVATLLAAIKINQTYRPEEMEDVLGTQTFSDNTSTKGIEVDQEQELIDCGEQDSDCECGSDCVRCKSVLKDSDIN